MKKNAYALVRKMGGAQLAVWENIPDRIEIPSEKLVIFGVSPSWENNDYKIVPTQIEIDDTATVPVVTLPPLLTRRQLLLGLMLDGFITADEALAAAQTGAVPAAIQATFDAKITDVIDRARAVVTWATARDILRTDPLTKMLQDSKGLTDAQLDALWTKWAAL